MILFVIVFFFLIKLSLNGSAADTNGVIKYSSPSGLESLTICNFYSLQDNL